MARLDDLEADIFDTSGKTTTAGIRQRIVDTAQRYGVDPALALAVAQTESGFRHTAVSPTGVTGLFQVTNATGQRYGQTPQTRTDPDVSMDAGIRHLGDLLQASGGDVRKALARYGDPKDTAYPDKVLQYYSAQARQVPRPAAPARDLDALERDIFGGPAAPKAPTPAAPAPTPLPGTRASQTPSDLVIEIGGETLPVPARGPDAVTYEGNILNDVSAVTPEGLALPGTLGAQARQTGKAAAAMGVQALTTPAGATVGALTAPVTGAAGPVLGAMAGSYYGHRLNQQLGLTPGTPTLLPQTLDDVVQLGAPALAALPGMARQALRWTRGGRALRAAEEATQQATRQAHATFQEQQAAYDATLAGDYATQRALRQNAVTQTAEQNAAVQEAWRQRGEEAYRTALTQTQQAQAQSTAAQQAAQAQRQALQDVADLPGRYLPTVPGQPSPAGRAPQRASQVLYERLDEVAGSAPVDLTPARQMAMDMQAQLQISMPALQPTRLGKIVQDLVEMGDEGSVAQVHQALKDLRPLTQANDGTIRGTAKQLVKGLHQALDQSAGAWPETAGARNIMTQARQAYRQEMAVDELAGHLTPGGPIVKQQGGRMVFQPDAFKNRLLRLAQEDDQFFRQSFPPGEWNRLWADVERLGATPRMPTVRQLQLPDAAPLPGMMNPKGLERPTPLQPWDVDPRAYRPVEVSEAPTFTPPPPVEPEVHMRRGWHTIEAGVPAMIALTTPYGKPAAIVGGALLAQDVASQLLARGMMSPTWRPRVLQAMQGRLELTPAVYAVLGAMAAAEGSPRGTLEPGQVLQVPPLPLPGQGGR